MVVGGLWQALCWILSSWHAIVLACKYNMLGVIALHLQEEDGQYAYVRFYTPQNAADALATAVDSKITVGGSVGEPKLLTGENEERYYEQMVSLSYGQYLQAAANCLLQVC